MVYNVIVKPIVKWAGGKRQLIKVILKEIPDSFNNYFEPFFGGGALFFHLKPKKAEINDVNKDLIDLYKTFQDKKQLELLVTALERHSKNHSKDYYYQIRELDRNRDYTQLPIVERTSRILYLNKACFNGLYRVNSEGFFNVPFNGKMNLKLYDKNNFDEIYRFMATNKIKISLGDFSNILSIAKKGDFVYLDPPYDNLHKKNTFKAYSKENFNQNEQVRLFNFCLKMDEKGVNWLQSNHDTSFIRSLYKKFQIISVNANRSINSDSSKRKNVGELLIKNY